MPAPRMTREKCQQVVEAVNNAIRAGYRIGEMPSAFEAAARAINLPVYTIRDRLESAKRWYGLEPIPNLPEELPVPVFEQISKPRVIVRAAGSNPEGESIRVTLIGDTHQQPGMSVDRFKWIARHVGETSPDRVIQLGDLGEWSSLERHSSPGSIQQKGRPSFQDDLASVEEALASYRQILGNCPQPHHLVAGNHEERILTAQGSVAELVGTLWDQFEDVLARYDWRHTPYRNFLFINSVGLTHVPQSLVEKPIGGETEQGICNKLLFSLVYGHTHRFSFRSVSKIGPQMGVQLLNVGSAMPAGYYAKYNVSEQGHPTFGIVDATFRGGHIVAHRFIPMTELEACYS
jgi:hypothetical protein